MAVQVKESLVPVVNNGEVETTKSALLRHSYVTSESLVAEQLRVIEAPSGIHTVQPTGTTAPSIENRVLLHTITLGAAPAKQQGGQ